jgi:hypothetical protein
MKRNYVSIYLVILMVICVTVSCGLPGSNQREPTETSEVISTQLMPLEDATATEEVMQPILPTVTDVLVVTEQPPTEMNSGQIAYRFDGQIWRYLVDSGEMIQLTSFGTVDEFSIGYPRAQFSPDGRYLAYNTAGGSWIQDFESDNTIDFSPYGQFFTWQGEGDQFYGIQGDLECPDIEDLEDQELINFDILRFSVDDLSSPTFIANIGGGLRFMGAISSDGEWASINSCGCYSECGPANLWHLPTLSTIIPPDGMAAGSFDFSPDNERMVFWQQQMYGYVEAPLLAANTDYTDTIELFNAFDAAPLNARWSPDGEWIAFTVVYFDDELTETDRCVSVIKPDGTLMIEVACQFANMAAWSPDGSQLLYSQNDGSLDQFFIYDLESWMVTPIPILVDAYTTSYIDWGRLP